MKSVINVSRKDKNQRFYKETGDFPNNEEEEGAFQDG